MARRGEIATTDLRRRRFGWSGEALTSFMTAPIGQPTIAKRSHGVLKRWIEPAQSQAGKKQTSAG